MSPWSDRTNPTQPDPKYARRLGEWHYIPDRRNLSGEPLQGYLSGEGMTIALRHSSEFLAELVRLLDELQEEFDRKSAFFPVLMPATPHTASGGEPRAVVPAADMSAASPVGELMHRA
jgi:hypothetical protein